MRIISQDGEYDFPYEMISVRTQSGIIYAAPLSDCRSIVVAVYEDEQEAERMLNRMQVHYEMGKKVFQFPEKRNETDSDR